jgi:hypothetical protein
MARWRQTEPNDGDDDLSAERAVWLRAPHESEQPTPDWAAPAGDRPPQSVPYPYQPSPRHHEPPDDATFELDPAPARPSRFSSDGFDDDLDPPMADSGERPPRRRRMVPVLLVTTLLAVAAAVVYGFVTKPEKRSTASPTRATTPTLTALPSFEPVAPAVEPSGAETDTPAETPATTATATATVTVTATATTSTSPAAASAPSSQPVVPPPSAPSPATFAAMAGEGCANTTTVNNWYTNGQNANWWTGSGGSSLCGSHALAMPTSGNPAQDSGAYIVWWFETAPVQSGQCTVDVFIPNNAQTTATAARYKFLAGRHDATILVSYTVNQTAYKGKWLRFPPVSITGGGIAIHLADRGAAGLYLGAAQARVDCVAS